MKYLCLIYEDESRFATTPKPEMDKIMSEYGAFGESIRKSEIESLFECHERNSTRVHC